MKDGTKRSYRRMTPGIEIKLFFLDALFAIPGGSSPEEVETIAGKPRRRVVSVIDGATVETWEYRFLDESDRRFRTCYVRFRDGRLDGRKMKD